MSCIERETKMRMVEFAQQFGQLAHAAARVNAGRHVLDTDDHLGPLGVLG